MVWSQVFDARGSLKQNYENLSNILKPQFHFPVSLRGKHIGYNSLSSNEKWVDVYDLNDEPLWNLIKSHAKLDVIKEGFSPF